MTDNEIIKALECCGKSPPVCHECKYKGKCNRIDCYDYLKRDAVDLINRQKAEIERLKRELISADEVIGYREAEIEVLKKIQQKVLSEQGSYTTNDRTVCDDCERLWIDSLLKSKSEAYEELANKIYRLLCKRQNWSDLKDAWLINGECHWLKAKFDNTLKELTEG